MEIFSGEPDLDDVKHACLNFDWLRPTSPHAGRGVREEAVLPTSRWQFTLLEIISNIRLL
jgi:hypothetical protein